MNDKIAIIEGNTFTIFSEVIEGTELFGWHIAGQGRNNEGHMYNGKPYSAPRAKFIACEKAIDDLADHLRYYHGIRRTITQEAFK